MKNEKVKIKKIAIWPLGKIMAAIMFAIGVLDSIGVLIASFMNPEFASASYQAMIIRPFAGLISGFVMGILFAAVYNWLGKYLGQIRIEVEEHKAKKTKK